MKEESEKSGLKLNIQKTKIMASDPIISWQIDGETVTELIWGGGGSKITAVGDCSHDIKRQRLLLGRKAMTNLASIYITICKIANGNLLYGSVNSNKGSAKT